MSNEVINEAEESAETESSAVEEKQETSVETSADETLTEQQASNEEDFGAILEKFEQEQTTFHSGETVTGKVIGVSEHGVVVDFGYKSEGIVPLEEFTSPEGEVTVKQGDDVEVVIRAIHAGDAPPVLSRSDALRRKSWEEIERSYNEGVPVKGRVLEKTKGGLRVDINGVEAFLPGSQVDSRPIFNLDAYKGQDIEAKIIKFSRKRNNIVLSRKALTDEVISKQKSETLDKIEQGYVIEGTIKNLTEYGAFVDIGGIDGLLHVTDMSWGRLQNPAELFKVGENIQVKVLKLDREKEKVSLGYKQLLPDPWSSVTEIYPVGARIKGKVSSVTEYGAFVELEPGVEGLVHVSEMSWSKRSKSPKQLVKPGDEVEVQVLGVDTEDRRISLGMRQLLPNPWETIAGKYRVGSTVTGKVRNITDFGAFIEIEEGVDGLVHVSDISWSKKIKHPKDVLKRGQEVQAVITSIDTDAQRLSLSIKELTPSSWESFVTAHRPGDIVRGKISRFAGFGVFVELADDLEGLCHISELSDERIEHPEKVFHIGQEMDFKILRIEHDNQKIGLSARAVGKDDEPVIDVKTYSTEAKGGMASLAELANLKFGTPKTEAVKEEPKKEAKKEEKRVEEPTVDSVAAEPVSEEIPEEKVAEEPAAEVSEVAEVSEDAEVSEEMPEAPETTEVAVETGTEETAETVAETEDSAGEAETETVEAKTEETETLESETETAEITAEAVEPEAPESEDTSEAAAGVVPETTEATAVENETAEAGGETVEETEEKSAKG
jgi:small subunit ribosomal protein S1